MRKLRMNRTQENYIVAKAALAAAKAVQSEKYNDFLTMKGLTGDDVGDDNFDALNAEYEIFAKEEIENQGIAWNFYKAAEQALIEFGITLVKEEDRKRVRMVIDNYYNWKKRFVDVFEHVDENKARIIGGEK